MVRSISRKVVLVLGLLMVGVVAVPSSPVSAAGIKYINASCGNGAYAHIGGSGTVTVYFYNYNGSIVSWANRNLGAGSSSRVDSYTPASYHYAYVTGNGYISQAGCR